MLDESGEARVLVKDMGRAPGGGPRRIKEAIEAGKQKAA